MGQRGFSLMELLVVTGILGVLSVLGMMNFNQLREYAYDAALDSAFHDAWISVQTGISYYEEINDNTKKITGIMGEGELTGWKKTFLPGIQVPKDMEMAVVWSPICTLPSCVWLGLWVKHCKTLKYRNLYYLGASYQEFEESIVYNWTSVAPCS